MPDSASHFPRVSSPHSYSREDYTLNWPDSDTHPHHINQKAEAAFSQLQKSYRQPLPRDNYTIPPGGNTLIIPIIQAGQFNIREEESIFQLLFRHLAKLTTQRPRLDLTSGYFSLYKPYQDLILQVPNLDCRIVAASPKVSFFVYGTFASPWVQGRLLVRPTVSMVHVVFLGEFLKAIHYTNTDL
jgi:CDP-diacylglycerol---glycerol-3-phosphate 3-phosphatidyltransferase